MSGEQTLEREANRQRLVECLNEISYWYAPERGLTAEYIALLLDIKGVTAPVTKPDRVFREGDQVRIVGGVAVFGGQLGEVREWDGSTYRVLVRNKAGFPWYVQLSPTQVESVSQPQEDT